MSEQDSSEAARKKTVAVLPRHQRGAILVTSLIFLGAATVTVTALHFAGRSTYEQDLRFLHGDRAYYLAERLEGSGLSGAEVEDFLNRHQDGLSTGRLCFDAGTDTVYVVDSSECDMDAARLASTTVVGTVNGVDFGSLFEQGYAVATREGGIDLGGSSKIIGKVFSAGDVSLKGTSTVVDKKENQSYELDEDFSSFDNDELVCDRSDLTDVYDTPWGYDEEITGFCYERIEITENREAVIDADNEGILIHAKEIDVEQGVLKIKNASSDNPAVLYVEDYFSMGGSSELKNFSSDKSNVILYYAGEESIEMGGNAVFRGVLIAPNAEVKLTGSSELIGYVEAKKLTGEGSVTMTKGLE